MIFDTKTQMEDWDQMVSSLLNSDWGSSFNMLQYSFPLRNLTTREIRKQEEQEEEGRAGIGERQRPQESCMFKYVQNRGREGKEKEHNKKIGKFLHEQYKKRNLGNWLWSLKSTERKF